MASERILITVKTYPTLSAKYGELVCTAGLREDGSWIRIYPVPFRQLEAYKKFPKYLDEFRDKDLHLYLGTTKKYDRWASNPFVIVGVFYPPIIQQSELDFFENR